MRSNFLLILLSLLAAVYPFAVYAGVARLGPSALLAGLLLLVAGRIAITSAGSATRTLAALTLAAASVLVAVKDWGSVLALRFYPVLMGAIFFLLFAGSLATDKPLIERIARLREPDLPAEGVHYTRTLTILWAGVLLLNTLVALYTALFSSLEIWTLYNGLLSYVLLGGFFAGEWMYRRHFVRRTS